MMSKFVMLKLAFVAIVAVLCIAPGRATEDDMKMEKMEKMENVEDSTVSPIADMTILEEIKTSTDRPPVMEAPKQEEKPTSQRQTVADFIIHPLIAFKPRNPEDDGVAGGKQANTQTTSSTTPSPWQLFGFNAGQGLGSTVSNSVSSLAGQVTGWLNDRIQFPGLVEIPVRESTTTSTSTTTTERPDVVVRIQHKATTSRPLISINDRNRQNLPRFESEENNNDDEEEEEEEEEGGENNEGDEEENEQQEAHEEDEENEGDEANEDNEDNEDNESPDENEPSNEVEENADSDEEEDNNKEHEDEDHGDDEDNEEETVSQRPNNRRRPLRNKNGNRNTQRKQQKNNKRHSPNRANKRKQTKSKHRRRPEPTASNEINDEEIYDDDNKQAGNDDFYYDTQSKRSQSSSNLIQQGQQKFISPIRQLVRFGVPAEIGATIRKGQQVSGSTNNKRHQQDTLYVHHNGQTIYLTPEWAQFQQLYAQPIVQKSVMTSAFPQPPLTKPLKIKGQPKQYITIPWAQLGISPPNNLVSLTEGIQAQPLILKIPQSAINAMQSHAVNRHKKKHPQLITPDAVPLLAEASLMDIFKPPLMPPSRTMNSKKASTLSLTSTNVTPVFMTAKPSSSIKTTSLLLEQHIRPGTIVEKAPELEDTKKSSETESGLKPTRVSKVDTLHSSEEKEYILVANDNEPLARQAMKPVWGDARFMHLDGNSQNFDVLPRLRFNLRRSGRKVVQPEKMNVATVGDKAGQLIPVQVVNEADMATQVPMIEGNKSETTVVDKVLSHPTPPKVPTLVAQSNQQSIANVMKTT